jgi:hypothetical protein
LALHCSQDGHGGQAEVGEGVSAGAPPFSFDVGLFPSSPFVGDELLVFDGPSAAGCDGEAGFGDGAWFTDEYGGGCPIVMLAPEPE